MNRSLFSNITCPLCLSPDTGEYHRDASRTYHRCGICGLIFVPSEYIISPEKEKARYDEHRNTSADEGYRSFLARLFLPLNARLLPQSSGLDFGSGPCPVLSQMFEHAGHSMTLYDPFYADNQTAFAAQYDFITSTEVFEHLSRPGMETDRLWRCLKAGGWLGIMTKPVPVDSAFSEWQYIRDVTHISFFSAETFRWLASKWNAVLTVCEPDVILFHKSE